MDWIKFVIPLIALAVWVLSSLMKNQDQMKNQPPRPAPPRPPVYPPRTPQEMDQFLEEVRRRAQQQQPQQPVPPPPPVRPAPAPPPPPVVAQKPPPPPRPVRQNQPVRTPAGKPFAKAPPRRQQVFETVEGVEVGPTPVILGTHVTKKLISPVANTVMELLQDRQSLAAAFVLQEVLGPPLYKRNKR